jgi:hypothetical protein
MSETEELAIDYRDEVTRIASEQVAGWSSWKREEYEREAARFREMGEVARNGK